MTKTKKILLIAGIVVLAVCLTVILAFCGGNKDKTLPKNDLPAGELNYTVQVKTASGEPLEGVGVYVYEDETKAELVWFDKTNAEGKMFFAAPASDQYVAELGNVPTGYGVEEYYPLTGELTEIILSMGVMSQEDMQNMTYKLGDMMMDFTVTDTEGNTYSLSELLKVKKAVVLNFWYIECQPCNMEFPFMQEAYEEFKDQIEILAMNPINQDEAAIAAFKKDNGLTFPMVMADPLWEQMMQLTAYPTTVVIDRFGNISLIHKGMINDTDTFRQLFTYFTAEDYQPTAIESIDQIVTKEEGSEENPKQQGGDTNFDITVGAGETYYLDLYKITGAVYLTVEGEDFTLTYDKKEYKNTDGSLTITITSEGPSSPVKLTITNNTSEEQTYTIKLDAPKGSYSNPYSLKLGEFSIKTKSGDEQGTYGVYKAETSGTLTVRCLESSVKKYGFFLYNLRSYAMRNADEDGNVDEDGYVTISVQVKKGDKIQFNVAVARNDSNSIPAGSFKFELMLTEGSGEEEKKPEAEKTTYTITVTDEDGKPVQGVAVNFKGSFFYEMPKEETTEEGTDTEGGSDAESGTDTEGSTDTESGTDTEGSTDSESGTGTEGDTEGEGEVELPEIIAVEVDINLTTNDAGVASTTQIVGPYTATIRVPEGYKLGQTQYDLTAEEPAVTVKLQKIIMKDYTVNLSYPTGEPVPDTIVIVGGSVAFTDAKGKVAFRLEENDYTAMIIGIPEEYVLKEDTYAFADGNTTLNISLGYGPGHETNPIVINGERSFTTSRLEPQQREYYKVYGASGATLNLAGTFEAFVILNGGEIITPDDIDGVITVPMPEGNSPVSLIVGNAGESTQSFTVEFLYPEGSVQNPEVINIRRFSIDVEEGNAKGGYAIWTPTKDGKVALSLRATSDTNCVVTVTSGETVLTMPESGAMEIPVKKNVPVLIHGVAIPEADGTYPAVGIDFSGTITYDPDPVGTTYKVTITNDQGTPKSNVTVEFVKNGSVAASEITNSAGVAEVILEPATYTVQLKDKTLAYDSEKAVVTETAPAVTIVVTQAEDPVPEGHTRYSVTVADYDGNDLGNLLVLFLQDGAPKSYSVVDEDGGAVVADLPTGTYQIQVAFLGGQKYYYEETTAVVTASAPKITVQAVSGATAEPEDNWSLGYVTQVGVGGTYVPLQTDIESYFYFRAEEPGVYRFTTSNPDAVITYWGDLNYPANTTAELPDYENNSFTRSINTTSLGQSHVVGISGTSGCILIITREGDAEEEIPYTVYEAQTPPTEYKFKGKNLTYVDLTAATETYKLVLNETDGYYHIGSANGPIMYVQIDANKVHAESPVAPPYIHLYKMVGGVDNTGTALRSRYMDAEGNEVREDYTACMLQYGEAADDTYGIYPLTQDLKYMIQQGGVYQGWWDADNTKGNLLFKDEDGNLDTSINLELGWMFACCYVDDGSVVILPQTAEQAEEIASDAVMDTQETLPPEPPEGDEIPEVPENDQLTEETPTEIPEVTEGVEEPEEALLPEEEETLPDMQEEASDESQTEN